jgi:lipopolysaccharide export system protein LptA
VKNSSGLVLAFALFTASFSGAQESISFSADSTVARFATGRERTELIGSARVETGELLIGADRIELFGDEFRYLRCSGSVRLENLEQGFLLRAEDLFVDRELEISRIEGYAEMEDGKNGLLIRGGFFEDRGGEEEVTLIQMGVRIMKISDGEVMICRSEFARYFRERQILELSGLPRVDWKGDVYQASRIIVDLETDEIRLEGRVTGTVETGTEEESP